MAFYVFRYRGAMANSLFPQKTDNKKPAFSELLFFHAKGVPGAVSIYYRLTGLLPP
jgi:hypothetical protein